MLNKGFKAGPATLLVRSEEQVPGAHKLPPSLREARTFNLQWHLTNRCDLKCSPCFFRTKRRPLSTEASLELLEDFSAFCASCHVSGHVCFSGGNPLMRADFFDLYRLAADLDFDISIQGNPTGKTTLKELQSIRPLSCFQTRLEGLPAYNDSIRGRGHFDCTLVFLNLLLKMGIPSKTIMILTRTNMDQVIPLSDMLQGKTDSFAYERLGVDGNGTPLPSPYPEEYRELMAQYVAAARHNPVIEFQDNLLNIALESCGVPLFPGCTGYGCGAAFNYMAILPDGEVHACRKYNSPIGSVIRNSLKEIYFSDAAARYRKRPDGCRVCPLVAVCGGCRAITSGCKMDEDRDVDPLCTRGLLQKK